MGVYLYPNNTETPLKNAYIGRPFPTSIVLNKSSISLTTVGQTEQLTATIEPEVSDQSVTWSSDDTTVATVSSTGLVTCVTPGECTITATTVNGLTASCGVVIGWTPGVNTVAYYPLDSINTVNDLSGNNYILTNSGSVAFGTNQGVDCAWFTSGGSSSGSRGLYRTSDLIMPLTTSDFTFLVWLYKGSERMYYNPRIIGRYNASIFTYAARNRISVADSTTYGVIPDDGSWFLFSCVYDHAASQWDFYKNGVFQNSQSASIQTDFVGIVLGTRDNLGTGYGDKWSGGMSNIIIENKKRTAQEEIDYYNQNKSLYGIS